MKRKIVVSPSIVWWTVGIVLAVGFVYVIRDVVALFFIALVLSAAMEPAVKRLMRLRANRLISVGLVYVLLLAVVSAFLSYLAPRALEQTANFIHALPQYAEYLPAVGFLSKNMPLSAEEWLGESTEPRGASHLGDLTQGIFSTTLGVFSMIVSFLAVLTIAFYLSATEDGVGRFLRSVTSKRYEEYVVSRAKIIYHKIGHWMLGQLLLMVIVGTLYFVVLSLLGVPNALVLALFGGIVEIIPYIGPVAAAIPAILFGFLVPPVAALLIAVSYFLIQQLENHVIVPQVMKRAVGLNPIGVILALLIGAKLSGILGLILAIPVATALNVFVKDVMERHGVSREELHG